jgi:nucleotide-binding universal stress UspA family protein
MIIEVAEESGAGLIVVGAHGNAGDRRFHIGSIATKLSHHAPTSLLIVRDG